MRSSDWSAAVCSSDLPAGDGGQRPALLCGRAGEPAGRNADRRDLRARCGGARAAHRPSGRKAAAAGGAGDRRDRETKASTLGLTPHHFLRPNEAAKRLHVPTPQPQARQSDVEGKSVSIRLDLGGRRSIKKKKK